MPDEAGKIFDAFYYQTGCGRPYQRDEEWLRSFDGIAARIMQDFQPHTVLDAGCALGFLVEGLRNHGAEAYGVDISEYAIQNVHTSIRPYCWVGSIAEPFPQKYDLIVTIEVLEHMPKADAEKAVENICAHTDDVLFSSGDRDFREITHLNLQPPEYWAAQFARHGFFRDVDFDATFLTPWAVRFRRSAEPVHHIVMGYERRIDRLIQENAAVRQMNLELRNAFARQEQENAPLKNALVEKDNEIMALKHALAQKEAEVSASRSQLEATTASAAYRAGARLRALAPAGSLRERIARGVWRALSAIRH